MMKNVLLLLCLSLALASCSKQTTTPNNLNVVKDPNVFHINDDYDSVISRIGEPEKKLFIGDDVQLIYNREDILMYPGGKCEISLTRRKLKSCEGCDLKRFKCN